MNLTETQTQTRTKGRRRVLVMLCTGARGGMRSVVESYRRDGVFEKYDVKLLETHREGSMGTRLAVAAAALLRFLCLLLSGRVAGVHAHLAMRGSFWRKTMFSVVARTFGVPVISHLHGSELKAFHASLGRLGRWLFRYQLESSRAVIVLSESWARFIAERAPRANVVVIPNYVRIPAFEELAGLHRDDEFVFLFLGLIGERKGVFDLLPAFRRASQEAMRRGVQLRLLIGGNGEVERARQRITQLGIDGRVELLGWVDAEQRAELLRRTDAFVLPSHNEGLPMAILEAMAASLPVVSTRVGGIPELVRHGTDGLLVNAGDSVALGHSLLALATDRVAAMEMGRQARRRVASEYSDGVVLQAIDRLYAECFA